MTMYIVSECNALKTDKMNLCPFIHFEVVKIASATSGWLFEFSHPYFAQIR